MATSNAMQNNYSPQPNKELVQIHCYIVSHNQMQAELLKLYLAPKLNVTCSCHKHLSQQIIEEKNGQPCIYLLDCLKMPPEDVEAILKSQQSLQGAQHAMIALFNINRGDMPSSLVRQYKIRGLFYLDDNHETLLHGIREIISGRLWLSRKVLSSCILMNDGSHMPTSAPSKDSNSLTPREKEILKRIVTGDSNKDIAEHLKISQHTVKTHLYNIFKKIDVPNRIQGALWASEHLIDQSV